MKLVWTMALLLWSTTGVAHAEVLCGSASNTVDEAQCMAGEVDKADAVLARYLGAAKARVKQASDSELNLDTAQAKWLAYRSAHCGDVYLMSVTGTIRYRLSAQCQIDLAHQRTHDVWRAFLTYMDSTAPVLPEP